MGDKKHNRTIGVLAEKNLLNRWLIENLERDEAIIST